MPVLGTPSRATRDLKRHFGDRAKVGAKGERFTAEELAKLFGRDPVTWVFHDLALPRWKSANVDHAVCRGSRVVILDTKCWAPGNYWSRGDAVFRGLKRFGAAEGINLSRLSAEIAAFLGGEITVSPLVVIWPSHPGRISARWPGASMRLPDDTPYCIGRDLGATLRRALGAGDQPSDNRVLEQLAVLTRGRRATS